jgi:cytochrome c oxidase subunit 2
VHVEVTAFQWGWRFSLDGKQTIGDADRPPVLRLPAKEPIEFVLTSRDVIHSFWVPGERFKRDAFPGRTTRFTLTFDEPGVYRGHCAEFCGLLHSDMDFTLVIR